MTRFRDLETGETYQSYGEMKKAFRELYDGDDPTNILTWHEYFEEIKQY